MGLWALAGRCRRRMLPPQAMHRGFPGGFICCLRRAEPHPPAWPKRPCPRPAPCPTYPPTPVQVALGVAMLGNRSRCQSVLAQCPAAGEHFRAAARTLGSAASLFSAVRAQPEAGGPLTGASSTDPIALSSCVGLYGAAQLGLGYGGALHLAWTMERLARLAFIRRTNK